MALLLAMYQKLRLIRERNQLTLELTQSSSKLTRIEKNIERTQKYYTSLFQQIDSQAKMLQNNATSAIQYMCGIGANQLNMNDITGTSGFVHSFMKNLFNGQGLPIKYGEDGKPTEFGTIEPDRFDGMYAEYIQNGRFLTNEDGSYKGGWKEDEVKYFMSARSAGTQQLQQVQFNAQQLSSNFANYVSIWTDAQKSQLECQQDAALEPLTYEQTMLELDKTLKENRLKRIESEIESYTQLADKGAEEMAPKFGLG